MNASEQLHSSIERYIVEARRSLSAARTYRDSHMMRNQELSRIDDTLRSISSAVRAHTCSVELRSEE